jgi:hypothetical protein
MQKSRVPRSSVMKMSHLSNHVIPKFSPKNMAHLLTLTSDLGGLHECHRFSNVILSPEPTNNYLRNENV